MDMIQAYAQAMPFYHAIAEGRDFPYFRVQLQTVKALLARYDMRRGKILDAACGSGELLDGLIRAGFDAYGSDGSESMLAMAKRHRRCAKAGRVFPACRWEKLNCILSKGRFDCILMLGHAFPHLKRALIPRVLQILYGGLRPGGIIALDLRAWTRDAKGALREAGRPTAIRRWLGVYKSEGRSFWLDDCCTYTMEFQRVHYYINHIIPRYRPHDRTFAFEYTLFDADELRKWFLMAGFAPPVDFHLPRSSGWPFIIAVAKKPHSSLATRPTGR